jgi:site-specific DNA-methyltransferase (adenine-specific)
MTNLSTPAPNSILHGDCIDILAGFSSANFDFALTDPPYLACYESRDGRRVRNDDNAAWLRPDFHQNSSRS